nr:inositol phosphorylceramide glucuronosyltransferase 1 [Tanacetum cinerariifolium]
MLGPVASDEMKSHLQALVADVEIHKAAKQLGGLKAPGENGFL